VPTVLVALAAFEIAGIVSDGHKYLYAPPVASAIEPVFNVKAVLVTSNLNAPL
jgi:hypothetical protein